MKIALFLFLSLVALPGFSQSKKALNRSLLKTHAQLVQKNDSLNRIINQNRKKLMDLITSSSRTASSLYGLRQDFQGFKTDIVDFQKKLTDLKFDPATLVRQDELNTIYGTYEDVDYLKEIGECKPTLKPATVTPIEDFSKEKLKVQNERLAQKNQEYTTVIESKGQILRSYEELTLKLNSIVRKMEAENVTLTRNTHLLGIKYGLLRSKCVELEEKKRLEEIAAENAKKEMAMKTAPKKNKKGKTIRFAPPVITEDVPSITGFNENSGFESDLMPPPPPPPTAVEYFVKQEPEIFNVVDEPASFPGGREAFVKYLEEKLVYPQVAKDAGISGKVYLKFVVSEQGAISNVKVMRGIPDCKECDREAIRVVTTMPKWIPGKNNGKAVNSYCNLPIVFKL
ncbi:energy transducer TonB [Fluviicola sp.]|uniref:energy transducer TonB n=1 Tax=Fluviicola sp. TaxID=1917219 RepID=UPI0031D860B1